VKPGPRIGWVLHALLEDVLDDPSKNNDAYMEEKTSKLLKLSDDELSKLNKKGKNKKEEAELEQLKSIKRKHKI